MPTTKTIKRLKRTRYINTVLKLVFAPVFGVTFFADLAALLYLGLLAYSAITGTGDWDVVREKLPEVIRFGVAILAGNILAGFLIWRIRGNEKSVLDSLVSLTYAEFSEALRDKRVVGDVQSSGRGKYHDTLNRCYLLDDGQIAFVQGTLNARRDRNNYRHFQHVETVLV